MADLVRIVSGPDGKAQGSKVILPDGSELPGVVSIRLESGTFGCMWKATIECHAEVDVMAERVE